MTRYDPEELEDFLKKSVNLINILRQANEKNTRNSLINREEVKNKIEYILQNADTEDLIKLEDIYNNVKKKTK